MAALEVDYEGVTIISTDAAGTKTLQTAGKYLDDDISINFAGGSGEIEGKQWIKNVTATLTSGSWAVLTGEQFIADNYNNSRLCVCLHRLGSNSGSGIVAGITSIIGYNHNMGGCYQLMRYVSTSGTGTSVAGSAALSSNSASGFFRTSSSGNLTVSSLSSSFKIGIGTYVITAYLLKEDT